MFGKKMDKKIKIPELLVDKDVISYGESFICTKNVSMVSISPIPASRWWILGLLLALLGFYTREDYGVLPIIIGVALFFGVLWYNSNRGENLAITLNSGHTFYFHCTSREFIRKVLKNMISSIKLGNHATYKVNFKSCTIDSISITGN